MEALTGKGYEVLYLTEPIDEVAVQNLEVGAARMRAGSVDVWCLRAWLAAWLPGCFLLLMVTGGTVCSDFTWQQEFDGMKLADVSREDLQLDDSGGC